MSKSFLPALQQALRRSFQSLESSQKQWASVAAECAPLLVSLGNLAEQSRALSAVQLSSTPLKVFPDLEDRLKFKLIQAADVLLSKLHEKMTSLQSVRDSVSNQVSAVVQLYQQNLDHLDLQAATERSAIVPSVADMMAWLQDAERHYRQQFLRRKALLQTLKAEELSQLESISKRWNSLENPSAERHVSDMLCKVSFFLESG
ncbi:ribosome biogenesis protein C1orf109 homolog [Synchiropus splendidus]|uniref:ribosome biogenesis protein C1orf109 homolog n=1 Tax=Synchiropus splendidus TaxID=270530 RepID=UPI00237E9BA3|nr:ribosome biogenesis protein C1orf109 homolog [Synchiropus splendidus]